jgi:hypothetical protein
MGRKDKFGGGKGSFSNYKNKKIHHMRIPLRSPNCLLRRKPTSPVGGEAISPVEEEAISPVGGYGLSPVREVVTPIKFTPFGSPEQVAPADDPLDYKSMYEKAHLLNIRYTDLFFIS